MVYCSNCGADLAEDSLFCPKCGFKTPKGKTANARYPSDQLTDAFYQVGVELEKAFNMAARETHQAIKRARDNLQDRPPQQTVACPKCGAKNLAGSLFCNNCGSRIAPEEKAQGGAT